MNRVALLWLICSVLSGLITYFWMIRCDPYFSVRSKAPCTKDCVIIVGFTLAGPLGLVILYLMWISEA